MSETTTAARPLTTAEAARHLGITRNGVLQRVASGRLVPMAQLPGRTGAYLFDAEQIARAADAAPAETTGAAS